MQLDLMGVKINTEIKKQVLQKLEDRFKSGQKTFIATPYSEFFYYSAVNYKFRMALKRADILIPDGISVLWLSYYLSLPFTASGYYLKIFQAFFQELYSLFQILLQPKKIRAHIPEKISGSDFFWDLIDFAERNNLGIFLLGGFGQTPKVVANKILKKYPKIKIAGYSNADPDKDLTAEINSSGAQIIFVAYGPINSVTWIGEHIDHLQARILIGVGGTFDYIAGTKKQPPQFVRKIGLEWLYRLLTQGRFKRIWTATVLFLLGALRYKVFDSMNYRLNAVGVIINQERKIFIARRARIQHALTETNEVHWQLPQGGVDQNENPEQAVLREMREETGMRNLTVLGQAKHTYTYLWPHPIRPLWFNRLKYKGQEQIIFYLKYSGENKEIKLDDRELNDYQWVSKNQLKQLIHPVRQEMLEFALDEIDKYL